MKDDRESLASSAGGKSLRATQSAPPEDTSDGNKEIWGARHTFAFMGFLGFAVIYAMRVNLSVAIVAMVAKNVTTNTNFTDDDLACPLPDDYGQDDGYSQPGEFDWDEKTQGLILGSFYYGYACTNLLSGIAAERFGGRLVGGVGILLTSVLTLLTPWAARTSDGLFIALRILEGMTEATSFPSANSLIAAWVLPEERSKYSAFIYAAASGFMCNSSFLGGWPSVFYVFGSLGVVWSVFWFPLVYDNPAQHPRISKHELEYLKPIAQLKTSTSAKKTPWKSIWTSKPVWSIIVIHFGFNWVFYTLLTELPTYLDRIQHFSLSSNGLLSALPYAIMYVYSLFHSLLMDHLTKNKTIRILNVRRLAMAVACFVPMLALIGMCFVGCNRTLAIVILCIAVGACGACYSGHLCSHVDLAPCYAGTLMGLTNTFGTIPGFASPAVTGAITNDNQTLAAWQTVFLISAAITGATALIYILTISADIQPWNYAEEPGLEDRRKSSVIFTEKLEQLDASLAETKPRLPSSTATKF
ncbi:sialin [Hyalella azteca]|uniref:Sialin n=1 Tax=Hyalella azteca TaxID=294128 RepID=A0A8B7MY56_HYAAZ|nr:sialin [Hyalella azteca]